MVTTQRWQNAQQYEQGYWANVSAQIETGAAPQLDWYRWRADQLVQRLERLSLTDLTKGEARVIEIGSGPVGVAAFFPAAERIAVDPLSDFYGSDPMLKALRSHGVDYRAGVGEKIPCGNEVCDLVIIENCIDHVQDITGVGNELRRVLKPGGILYLTVNSRTAIGYYVHRLLSRLQIDRGHPHTFTPDRGVALVHRHGFEVLQTEVGSAWDAHKEDLRGPSAKKRLKAVLGVSEFLITIVARKPLHPAP